MVELGLPVICKTDTNLNLQESDPFWVRLLGARQLAKPPTACDATAWAELTNRRAPKLRSITKLFAS